MSEDKSNVQNRLDQAMNGSTPEINPDEQHRNLGTFRERVDFAIPISQALNQNALTQMGDEMDAHPDFQLMINGNMPNEFQSPYMKLAANHNIKFTLKNDKVYGSKPEDYAAVLASSNAIHKDNVDFDNSQTHQPSEVKKEKPSFLNRLFKK